MARNCGKIISGENNDVVDIDSRNWIKGTLSKILKEYLKKMSLKKVFVSCAIKNFIIYIRNKKFYCA